MAADIAVHMYNSSYPEFEANFKRKMARGATLPFRQVGAYHKSTPRQVVDAVKSVVGTDRVAIMRIMSHGNSGVFYFPGLWNYNLIALEYADLRSVFTPLARLEIHGCGIASETDVLKPGANPQSPRRSDAVPGTFTGNKNGQGLRFLKRVASFFNVPTVGAVNVQPADSWSYEGDTVTAYPFSDKFYMDSEGTRIWDFDAQARAADQFKAFIIRTYVKTRQFKDALRQFKELAKSYPNTVAGQLAARITTVREVEAMLDPLVPD